MTREKLQKDFSTYLCKKVLDYYGGRFPSSGTFAMHFNLRCPSHRQGISDETARRWLRGTSMPDTLHTQILVTWLALDLHTAFGCPEKATDDLSTDPIINEFLTLLPSLAPEKRRAFLHLLRLSVEPR